MIIRGYGLHGVTFQKAIEEHSADLIGFILMRTNFPLFKMIKEPLLLCGLTHSQIIIRLSLKFS